MQSGELVVTATGSLTIPLAGEPREVSVRFRHPHHHIPCNPHHHDKLEYQITSEHLKLHHDHLFFLVIEWEVSGIREIEWSVLY
jgi:hypothetical protein